MTSPEWSQADDDDSDRTRSTFDRADNTARLALELAEAKREIARLRGQRDEARRNAEHWRTEANNMLDDHHAGSEALVEMCERVDAAEAEIARLHRDALAEAQAYRAMFARAQEAEAKVRAVEALATQWEARLGRVWRGGSDATGETDPIGAPILCPHHDAVIRNAEDIDRLDHEVTHAQAVEMARQCCQWRLG